MKETYLGDGLYASHDGFMITLRAPRGDVDHWVGLEPDVLEEFERFVAEMRRWQQEKVNGIRPRED